jgi:hypothetical protein
MHNWNIKRRRERGMEAEKILEVIMTENFPKLTKDNKSKSRNLKEQQAG